MVDFNKRVGQNKTQAITDPIELYDTLDRAHDKGPLRPAQIDVLRQWDREFRKRKDVILKLHTGQGKTLIGLLILQARINEGLSPALYLCPNNFLINQTQDQANQFGIRVCVTDGELPDEFLDGRSIFVTSVQKLFNGLTKFKLGNRSIPVETVLIDDCHACIDSIRDAFSIKFDRADGAYEQFLTLVGPSLESQGAGTFADIKNKSTDSFLPVPYWDWREKQSEIVAILAKHVENKKVKFTWPLIKDSLADCQCVISSGGLEIAPYLPPLHLFGSYGRASHRVFMSATVTDDAFLVKGLRLDPTTIRKPLVYEKEKWSGEKMILVPSLIDEQLNRSVIVNTLGKPVANREYGVVALVPGFKWTKDWEGAGATVATTETIEKEIDRLRAHKCREVLAIANRYDGIDLPDAMCRILVFDSKPFSESLVDRYEEWCRASSEITAIRSARTIEQGLGRSVRGEKDYCVFILIGPELVRFIRSKDSRHYFSHQTSAQVRIGLEIAEMAKEEMAGGVKPLQALINLINQCLMRDQGWKAFYNEQMESVTASKASGKALAIFQTELEAETAFQDGNVRAAVKIIQNLIDQGSLDASDKGWYLQELARYTHAFSKDAANTLQLQAHKQNRYLMRPQIGMTVDKLIVSQQRIENIVAWVRSHDDHEELGMAVEEIIGHLSFGVRADRFESAFHQLGEALGFASERPDKEWKEGPDNLWALREGEYLLVECKSEVHLNRADIESSETVQMTRAVNWFKRIYPGSRSTNLLIIPTNKVGSSTAFSDDVRIVRAKELSALQSDVRAFFKEFGRIDFQDLSPDSIQKWLTIHRLSTDKIAQQYSASVRMS
ncbi:MAG: hypothetical protein QOG51_1574 [Verrucomicrobiota bacterium]